MNDELLHHKDARWINDKIDTVIRYRELDNFDHSAFQTGKDMSYVEEMLGILYKFND
jgi:hypothetical protein